MSRNDDVLERLAPLSGAPSRGLEDLLRLRAKRQLARKVGAIAVVATLIVALAIGLGIEDRSHRPANPPKRSHTQSFTGMVITYTSDPYSPGDLVAQDPATGEVDAVLGSASGDAAIYDAAISGDGRWAAFDRGTQCGRRGPGLWVTNGADEPRQVTLPCAARPKDDALGLWEWSPSGARLLVVLGSPNRLILIDPATGDRTDLGQPAGEDVTSIAWSPDGTRIAYAASGGSTGPSVYTVAVDGGEHALIADSIGHVPGGEEGSGLQWSPDGTKIAILTENGTLSVMNPDGSHLRQLAAGQVLIEHILGSPNIAWSPDGTRIAYATDSDEHDHVRIWSAALDGSARVLVFDAGAVNGGRKALAGGPVWSPDGTEIAFRDDDSFEVKVWLVANADGSGDVHEIDELQPLSWRSSRYFCECYG